MGKDRNKGVRTKSHASSSSEAAAILVQQGFIGFGGSSTNLLLQTEELEDQELQLNFKALGKKDSTTKIKALQELGNAFKSLKDESVKPVLQHWSQVYPRLALDNDRRVREICNQSFLVLIRSVKKELAPFLKKLISSWILNLFDPYKEVCIAAQNAFLASFSENKQVSALIFCKSEIMSSIDHNLQSSENSNKKSNSLDFTDERFERIISSSILSLGFLIDKFPEEENQKTLEQYKEIINDKFWKFCSSKSPLIRRSMYSFISTASQKLPILIEENLQYLSPVVLGILNEKESSAHQEMWQTYLVFLKNFPHCWRYVSVDDVVLPRLWEFLKNGAFGSGIITYPSLLPLVSFIPTEKIGDIFFKQFLQNLWEGLKSDNISKHSVFPLIASYMECLQFFLLQNRKNPKLQSSLANEELVNLVIFFLQQEDLRCEVNDFLKKLMDLFAKLNTKNYPEDILLNLWKKLESFVFEQLKNSNKNPIFFLRLSALLETFAQNNIPNSEEFINSIFTTSLQSIHSPDEYHFLSLLEKISSSVGLSKLLTKTNFSFDHFFEDYLASLTKEWIQTAPTLALKHLFSLIRVYLFELQERDPIKLKQTWNHLIDFVLQSKFPQRNLDLLLQQICITLKNEIWQNYLLNEYCDTLVRDVCVNLKSDKESMNILKFFISGKEGNASPLIDENHLNTLFTSFKDILQAFLEEKFQVIQHNLRSIQVILDILDCLKSFFKSPSFQPSILLHMDLTSILFDFRICTTLYHEHLVYVDGSILKREIQEGNEMLEEIIEYSLTAKQAREIWKDCSLISKMNSQEKHLFYQQARNRLFQRLFEELLPSQIPSLLLLGDQTFELCTNSASLEEQQELIDFILVQPEQWNSKSFAINSISFVDCLNTSITPQFESIHKEENQILSILTQYTRLGFFLVESIQALGLQKSLHERGFIVAYLLHSSTITHSYLITEFSTKTFNLPQNILSLWNNFCEMIQDFCEHTLWPFLMNSPTRFIDEVLSSLFEWSFKQGKNYSITLLNALNQLNSHKSMDSNLLFQKQFSQITVSNINQLQTWQAFTQSCISKLESNLTETLKRKIYEELKILLEKKQYTDQISFLLESFVCLYPKGIPLDEVKEITEKLEHKNPSELKEYTLISLSKFFQKLLVQKNALHKSLWIYIFNLCLEGIKKKNSFDQIILQHYLFQLFLQLNQIFFSENESDRPDYVQAVFQNWIFFQKDIFNSAILSFLTVNKTSFPKDFSLIYTLSEVISLAPLSSIQEKEDQLYPLLLSRHIEVQTATFLVLSKILADKKIVLPETNQNPTKKENFEEEEKESFEEEEKIVKSVIPKKLREIIENLSLMEKNKEEHEKIGFLLSWLLLINILCPKDLALRSAFENYLRHSGKMFQLLFLLFEHYIQDTPNFDLQVEIEIKQLLRSANPFSKLCIYFYFIIIKTFPVGVRLWRTDEICRKISQKIDKFTIKYISPILLVHEMNNILKYDKKTDGFSIKATKSTFEVVANYEKEELTLSIMIRLPDSYPLKPVEVECIQKAGVKESLLRKWLLSMTTLLLTQDGSILEAILLWKSNLDKHFEGVDVCPICYSLFHASNRSLPSLACKTCKNKFHSACMYKWIKISHKTDCPLCKTPFY